jgi:hypothetical protein
MANKRDQGPVTHASGRVLVAFRNGVYLIETRKTAPRPVAVTETAAEFARKLGRALNKPGISREAVFGTTKGGPTVYAYSVHPDDPTKLVRESVDGKRTVGRMIDGRFRAVRAARVAGAPAAEARTEPTVDETHPAFDPKKHGGEAMAARPIPKRR